MGTPHCISWQVGEPGGVHVGVAELPSIAETASNSDTKKIMHFIVFVSQGDVFQWTRYSATMHLYEFAIQFQID